MLDKNFNLKEIRIINDVIKYISNKTEESLNQEKSSLVVVLALLRKIPYETPDIRKR